MAVAEMTVPRTANHKTEASQWPLVIPGVFRSIDCEQFDSNEKYTEIYKIMFFEMGIYISKKLNRVKHEEKYLTICKFMETYVWA